MSQQHARGGHVDDSDALLGGDGFENVFALRGAGGDAGAFATRITRVQNIDWDIFLDSGQHRRRVKNLRAKVGELGGLVEADDLNTTRFGTDARVGGENAVDVGPDLDAVGAEASAEDGGREIGAAAADCGGDPGAVGSDESAHDWDLPGAKKRRNFFLQPGVGLLVLRDGLYVGVIGDQNVAGVDVGSFESAGSEGGGDDFAR